jgi:hypothetical protein
MYSQAPSQPPPDGDGGPQGSAGDGEDVVDGEYRNV